MDELLLVLARNQLRVTMVLLGIAVLILSSLIRKKRRVSARRRSDEDDAADLDTSLAGRFGLDAEASSERQAASSTRS